MPCSTAGVVTVATAMRRVGVQLTASESVRLVPRSSSRYRSRPSCASTSWCRRLREQPSRTGALLLGCSNAVTRSGGAWLASRARCPRSMRAIRLPRSTSLPNVAGACTSRAASSLIVLVERNVRVGNAWARRRGRSRVMVEWGPPSRPAETPPARRGKRVVRKDDEGLVLPLASFRASSGRWLR
jgi:hypothetical protein